MTTSSGQITWYIPDDYLPPHSAPGEYVNHQSMCVLNVTQNDAHGTQILL